MKTATLRDVDYLMAEEWRDVAGYEGYYQASSFGRIKSIRNDIVLVQYVRDGIYPRVTLALNGNPNHCTVHRIIAETFIPNPENKRSVNHKDGDKINNRVDNLEWATYAENIQHAYDNGLMCAKKGKESHLYGRIGLSVGNARPCQCLCTGRIISFSEAARELDLAYGSFSRMMNGTRKNWTQFIPV